MDEAKTSVTDSTPVGTSGVDTEQDDNNLLKAVIDEIIKIKRQAAETGDQADFAPDESSVESQITNEDRIKQLKKYKLLEELKGKFKGRVLFEYDEGLETLVKEVIV